MYFVLIWLLYLDVFKVDLFEFLKRRIEKNKVGII